MEGRAEATSTEPRSVRYIPVLRSPGPAADAWGGQIVRDHLSLETEVVKLRSFAAVRWWPWGGRGGPTMGRCVPAEWVKWYGDPYMKREKNAVVSSQARGAWNGSRAMNLGIS